MIDLKMLAPTKTKPAPVSLHAQDIEAKSGGDRGYDMDVAKIVDRTLADIDVEVEAGARPSEIANLIDHMVEVMNSTSADAEAAATVAEQAAADARALVDRNEQALAAFIARREELIGLAAAS